MSELLDALGIHSKIKRRIAATSIWVSFALAMILIAAIQAAMEDALDFSAWQIVAVSAAVWVIWSIWHSFLFGWSRARLLRRGQGAYRKAFMWHIFPGITIGFSQMLRPAWNGDNLSRDAVFPQWPTSPSSLITFCLGGLVFLLAFAIFASAWRTLGAARVGFVYEFVSVEEFEPLRHGPYRIVRHPLFWSGVLISLALALLGSGTVGYALAVLNTLYGFVYNVLEDRRLDTVFGANYSTYAREVPHIIPARARALLRVSRQRSSRPWAETVGH